MATPGNFPITPKRLEQIVKDAINSALSGVEFYDHPKTEQWNKTIIDKTLKAVVAEATPQGSSATPYKFAINSTIVQHVVPNSQVNKSMGTNTGVDEVKSSGSEKKGQAGRRGMHSSTGGFWNEKTDGMWSYKYEGENLGLDVILMVIWIAV